MSATHPTADEAARHGVLAGWVQEELRGLSVAVGQCNEVRSLRQAPINDERYVAGMDVD